MKYTHVFVRVIQNANASSNVSTRNKYETLLTSDGRELNFHVHRWTDITKLIHIDLSQIFRKNA